MKSQTEVERGQQFPMDNAGIFTHNPQAYS